VVPFRRFTPDRRHVFRTGQDARGLLSERCAVQRGMMATSIPRQSSRGRGSHPVSRALLLLLLPTALFVSACTQQSAASDDAGENVIVYNDEDERPQAPQLQGED